MAQILAGDGHGATSDGVIEGIHAFLSLAPVTSLPGVDPDRDPALPLQGLPVAVKDNLATLELPTTCGSRFLEGYVSPFEATAVRRLRRAGGVVVGKTNMDEFGMGSSTEFSGYGVTRNPHDLTRVPGGSSGGSAAAVAAGWVPAALGSDTGGSVRQPAAFCGVVGMKPTYGRVSRFGLVAFASSLDQVGVFGRNVRDAASVLQAIMGWDRRDSTSLPGSAPDLLSSLEVGLRGRTVGLPREYFHAELDPGVARACDAAVETLKALGAHVREVSLPLTHLAIPAYYVLATAEASSNLARFDGVRYGIRPAGSQGIDDLYTEARSRGFGPEVKRRILLGTFALSAGFQDAYYGRAQKARRLLAQEFRHVFASGVDLLFTPTTPTPAFALGERNRDPMEMYLSDVFTVTANLAGLPALSLPVGTEKGLPVGGQLLAPFGEDALLLQGARALEKGLRGEWDG